MIKVFALLSIGFSITIPTIAQSELDTLYYDKNWKGVENKIFATYYRVVPISSDSSSRKHFRDYYITGELQAEGGFIAVDKYDDSKSIFDGEMTSYYRSGKIDEKSKHINGKREGEFIKYREDGAVEIHANFKNDKLHGIYTKFLEDGNFLQIEFNDGKPKYENPDINEIKLEYRDGIAWMYYNKNGITIGLTNNMIKDYGKYFQIPIIIANNSILPIEFNPNNITATLINKKGKELTLKVYSVAEYMKKVRQSQNWAIALTAIGEGLAASSAGYSSSTTNTSYSGYSSSYGSASAYGSGGYARGSYSGNSSYYGSSSSRTTSYNGAAAYQAQVIASNRVAAYNNALLSERATKNEGYLKRTTIHPGETISGYVNIERKKGISMTINIDINGVIYTFPWDITPGIIQLNRERR